LLLKTRELVFEQIHCSAFHGKIAGSADVLEMFRREFYPI
jgi:hypothetical protein